MVEADSDPPILRVSVWRAAYPVAAATGKNAENWNVSLPGRIIINTPMRPMTTAIHRLGPALSPKKMTANRVMMRGDTKKIEVASANFMDANPAKKHVLANKTQMPRRK